MRMRALRYGHSWRPDCLGSDGRLSTGVSVGQLGFNLGVEFDGVPWSEESSLIVSGVRESERPIRISMTLPRHAFGQKLSKNLESNMYSIRFVSKRAR